MVGKTKVTFPAYADDLALMALYKPGLNEMLLSFVSEHEHMGVVLSSERKQSQKIYADRIAVGRNAIFIARRLGSHNVPLTPRAYSAVGLL